MPDAERTQVQRAIAEYTAAMETQDRHRRLERFARAEQLFRQTMEGSPQQSPVHNAALYVNLGNAALQAERLGPAIAAYRRARWLCNHNMPRRGRISDTPAHCCRTGFGMRRRRG